MAESVILTPKLMGDLIREQATRAPDRVGLIFEEQRFTYKEMNERANKAAAALKALGVARGDRVAWLARNVSVFWDTLFGAAKIGAVMTPINWRLAPAEIAQILDDSGARIFIGEKMFIDPLKAIDAAMPETTLMLETGEGSFDALIDQQAAAEPEDTAALDDAFVQLYTSGTTGLPKGVVLSNRAYQQNSDMGAELRITGAQERRRSRHARAAAFSCGRREFRPDGDCPFNADPAVSAIRSGWHGEGGAG